MVRCMIAKHEQSLKKGSKLNLLKLNSSKEWKDVRDCTVISTVLYTVRSTVWKVTETTDWK